MELLLLLFSDEDESLRRGHPCTRPSVHDDFKVGATYGAYCQEQAVEVPVATDNEVGNMKEVEDGASEDGMYV